jgi:hypothetical protein
MEERKKERRVRVEVEEEKEMQQAHFKAKPVGRSSIHAHAISCHALCYWQVHCY